jgi:hypothetical protein
MPTIHDANYEAMWAAIKDTVHGAGYELSDIRSADRYRITRRLLAMRVRVTAILHKECGYSITAVADFLHVDPATIKRRLNPDRLGSRGTGGGSG